MKNKLNFVIATLVVLLFTLNVTTSKEVAFAQTPLELKFKSVSSITTNEQGTYVHLSCQNTTGNTCSTAGSNVYLFYPNPNAPKKVLTNE